MFAKIVLIFQSYQLNTIANFGKKKQKIQIREAILQEAGNSRQMKFNVRLSTTFPFELVIHKFASISNAITNYLVL